jgi:hypothetical protein
MPYKFLQQFITIQSADQASGVVVIGDIGGILGKQVTDDLVNGIVTFFAEGTVNGSEDFFHFLCIFIWNKELNGVVIHTAYLL